MSSNLSRLSSKSAGHLLDVQTRRASRGEKTNPDMTEKEIFDGLNELFKKGEIGDDLVPIGQHKLASLHVVAERLSREGWEDVPKERGIALLLILKDGSRELRDLARGMENDKLLEQMMVIYLGYVQPALIGKKRSYEETMVLLEGQEAAWKLAVHQDRDFEEWRPQHPLSFSRGTFYNRREEGRKALARWLLTEEERRIVRGTSPESQKEVALASPRSPAWPEASSIERAAPPVAPIPDTQELWGRYRTRLLQQCADLHWGDQTVSMRKNCQLFRLGARLLWEGTPPIGWLTDPKPPSADEVWKPEEALDCFPRLAVYGSTGIGKTTLAHYISRRLLEVETELIPVLLDLSSYIRRGKGQDLLVFALSEQMGLPPDTPEVQALLRDAGRLADEGRLLLLVDGWEEIPGDQRKSIADNLARYPRYLILSQPEARIEASSDKILFLLGLDRIGINQYLRCWEEARPGKLDAARFAAYLEQEPLLLDLARNPRYLGWMCQEVERSGNAHPVKAVLVDRVVKRAIEEGPSPEPLRNLEDSLQELAHWTLHHSIREEKDGWLSSGPPYTAFPLEEAPPQWSSWPDARGRLSVALRCGILEPIVPGEKDELRFSHSAFQSYSAAGWLVSSSSLDNLPAQYASRPHWREALQIAAGLLGQQNPKGVRRFMALIVRSPWADVCGLNWLLAGQCAAEVPPKVWEELAEKGDTAKVLDELKTWLGRWDGAAPTPELKRAVEPTLIRLGIEGPPPVRPIISHGPLPLETDQLVATLADPDAAPKERDEAMGILSHLPGWYPAGPLLDLAEDNPNPIVRRGVLKALGRVGEEALARLFKLLEDPDPGMREETAKTLGRVRSQRAEDALLGALDGEETIEIQEAIIEALGKLGSQRATQRLVAFLTQEKLALTAATALGRIGGTEAIGGLRGALYQALDEGNAVLYFAPLTALRELGGVESLSAALTVAGGTDQEALKQTVLNVIAESTESECVPILTEAISAADAAIRQAAVRALGRISEPRVAKLLLQAMDDQDAGVREAAELAIISVGRVEDDGAIDALVDAFEHGSEGAKRVALFLLPRVVNDGRKREVQRALKKARRCISLADGPVARLLDKWANSKNERDHLMREVAQPTYLTDLWRLRERGGLWPLRLVCLQHDLRLMESWAGPRVVLADGRRASLEQALRELCPKW
jgi:HEAT repeat protein